MIPEEEKTQGAGNSVNAEGSTSSGQQRTPGFGTPSVQGSRKAAGRSDSGERNPRNGSPQQSTSARSGVENAPSPGRTTDAKPSTGEPSGDSGPYPGDKNPEKGTADENRKETKPAKPDNTGEATARFAHIPGWGVDANTDNDPTYPMRDRENTLNREETWQRPPVQPLSVELLFSTEHKNRPAVFGTASPPSGLSGMLRRRAFSYSESDYRHWLPLIMADRINVVEGVISDLAHGRLPNPIAERGLRAEWKYNRKACVRKAAVTVGAISLIAAAAILTRGKKKPKGLKAFWM